MPTAYVRCLVACLHLALGLKLGEPFLGQGTVIQQDVATLLWGTSADTKVQIRLDGVDIASAQVTANGSWTAVMPPQGAAFNRTLVLVDISGQRSQVVSFGLVLMCAGQSNMGMTVSWPKFHADNGTAECAAAGRYTGGISLKSVAGRGNQGANLTKEWFPVTSETLPYYSALCWYTGKALYDHHKGKVPIGLIQGNCGGTPIEKFVTKRSVDTCKATGSPGPEDQFFYDRIVGTLTPYTVGAILWDQAEADVTRMCAHVEVYPCLEQQLVRTWRRSLGGNRPAFVAVQLPGYTGGVTPLSSVFEMRLAQEAGLANIDAAALLPTYDLSCPHCPSGSVHNTDKVDVGARAAVQLRRLVFGEGLQAQGPRVSQAVAQKAAAGGFEVSIRFSDVHGSLLFVGTRNCTQCCTRPGSDFDISLDGRTWVNGTGAEIVDKDTVRFQAAVTSTPKLLRYTASMDFPQFALHDKSKLPAFPFKIAVQAANDGQAIFSI